MLAPNGNIDQVYRELQQRTADLRRMEREINHVVSTTAKLEAEIGENAEGNWYIVMTRPGDDLRALRWLARRRFGAFMPTAARPDWGGERTLPGIVLVYVSDIGRMRSRIMALPGVTGLLCDPVTGHPMIVKRDDIARMRHQSFEVKDRPVRHAPPIFVPQEQNKPRRPNKYERKALDRLKIEMRHKGIDYNEQQRALINCLEPNLRIAVLEQTLRPQMVSSSSKGT